MPFKYRGPSRTLLSIALFSVALGLTGCSGSGGSDNIIRGDGGFYFDRDANAWKDPSGEICHTCTPDNGFPDHSR